MQLISQLNSAFQICTPFFIKLHISRNLSIFLTYVKKMTFCKFKNFPLNANNFAQRKFFLIVSQLSLWDNVCVIFSRNVTVTIPSPFRWATVKKETTVP